MLILNKSDVKQILKLCYTKRGCLYDDMYIVCGLTSTWYIHFYNVGINVSRDISYNTIGCFVYIRIAIG